MTRKAQQKAREQHRILGMIRNVIVYEGDKMTMETVDGQIRDLPMLECTARVAVTSEAVENQDVDAVFDQIRAAMESIEDQKAKHLFELMDAAVKESGNIINGGGTLSVEEGLLEMLSRIEIDFDEEGNPELPTLVVSPVKYSELVQRGPLKDNPDFDRRWDEMIERKRGEWRDRESRRKLVD